MKYSYTWLKDLSGTKKSPERLAELLTMRAFELENMKTEEKETQMEFSVLPNRGHDALSHIGMAREICACEGRKLKLKLRFKFNELIKSSLEKGLKVEIRDKKFCIRYIGAVLENIKITPSPKWMQKKLLVCGVKPINNIVDITNYVMLETGQPLHAFDKSKVKSQKSKNIIIVRRAEEGEKIKLLDEKIYKLRENDLVIADSAKTLALAGVMGGFDSSITDKTTSIIFESANFNSTSIRKTRFLHNITTESSYRFERNIDPNLAEIGMMRAIELIYDICGKDIKVTSFIDVYPKKIKPWQIKLNTNYTNRLLGENIPAAKMKNILENLDIKLLKRPTPKAMVFEIPTYRIDLKTQEDLIEEIGRIYGYENIKEQAPVAKVKTPLQNLKRDFENKLRDILTGLGFSEVMNYSFYGADEIAKCNLKVEDHIEVANPLSLDQQYLRWSLAPNIIKNVELNLKNFPRIQIFEIGNEFCKIGNVSKEDIVLVGAMAHKSIKESPFSELKGKIEGLLTKLGYNNVQYSILNTQYLFWHRSRTAEIFLNNKEIGKIGEVNPIVLQKYSIKSRIAVFNIRLSEIIEKVGYPKEKIYYSISKFPIVERDISMFIQEDIVFSEIEAKIRESGGKLLKRVELFDIFEKEGKKSLALRLQIGSDVKTLTSAEIDTVMKKIISALEKDLKIKVRK